MGVPGVWGEEFLVNAMTSGAQMSPVITALVGGRFAIAYTDYSSASFDGFTDFSDSAVRVQVFNSNGTGFSSAVQVNTVIAYSQVSPSIAPLQDGGFVVTYTDSSTGWNSWGDDVWYEAVRMQRFHDDASAHGTESLVNTTVMGSQDYSNVALLENGQFIVAWTDAYSSDEADLNAQLFNADGSTAGAEFQLNDDKPGLQVDGIIAGLTGGGYVVTWVDATGVDGDLGTIMVRMFEADGTPTGAELQVNTTGTSDQFEPSVTALAGGGFFIAWTDNSRGVETGGDDASHYAVRGQVFDATGTAVGSEFRVNLVTTYGQSQPAVLALADGRFIVAFSDTSSGLETGLDDAEFGAIRARIFNADGSPDGDEFLVNVTTVGHQNEPQMTELSDGRVVFTWTDYSYGAQTDGDDASSAAVRARILDLRDVAIDLAGTDGADDFIGTGWNDTLTGGEGNDSLTGADGNDNLHGDAGNDTIGGGNGDDLLYGDDGDDTIKGNEGDDEIFGGGGNDSLSGDDGNDGLIGGSGADLLYGGGGDDTIAGNGGDDEIFGDQGQDEIIGNSGNDTLSGGDGNDSLLGGNGDDFLYGGNGGDTMMGNGGNDEIAGEEGEDKINGGSGNDTLSGGDGDDSLVGGSGADLLYGGNGNDTVKGYAGHDDIQGNKGSDKIFGGTGDDTLSGGKNADDISGGKGQDQIIGGKGGDVLTGGKNADTFVFTRLEDSGTRSNKRDVITDFAGGRDHIDLTAFDGDATTGRRDPLFYLGDDSFTGTQGEIRYKATDEHTMIQVDLDGDKSIDMKIELTGWHELGAHDFIL